MKGCNSHYGEGWTFSGSAKQTKSIAFRGVRASDRRSKDSATSLRCAQNDGGGLVQRESPAGGGRFSGRARQEAEPEAYRDVFTASAEPPATRRRRIEATNNRCYAQNDSMAEIPA